MACVLHASDRGIFVGSIESVGKQARDESGKHPVNENDEGNFAHMRATRRCKIDESAGFQCAISCINAHNVVASEAKQSRARHNG